MTGFLHGARGKFPLFKNKFLILRKKLKNFVDFLLIFSIVFFVQPTSHQLKKLTPMLKSQTALFINLSDIISLSEKVENSINELLEDSPWTFGDTIINLVNIKIDFIPELRKLLNSSDNTKEETSIILDTIINNIPSDVKYINLVG